jgi:hypothetical protein
MINRIPGFTAWIELGFNLKVISGNKLTCLAKE